MVSSILLSTMSTKGLLTVNIDVKKRTKLHHNNDIYIYEYSIRCYEYAIFETKGLALLLAL